MMTSSFNWLQRSKQSHPHCSGGGNGWSSKDNISCIGIGRGWQFPIPSADEEGQNLQLCRKHFAVEGGVASLWCKKPIPPRIIQSQRSQGHHHNSGSNGVNNKMDSQVLSDVSEASVTSLHHPAPAWLDVKGLDKGRSGRKRQSHNEQLQPIGGEVITRKTTLAVSLSSDKDEYSHDEMSQEESCCIEKSDAIIHLTKENDSSDSLQSLVSKRSQQSAERDLWDNREEISNDNVRRQLEPPPRCNKLRRLVKTSDKDKYGGGISVLNTMQQQKHLGLPENSTTTPKRRRLVKTTRENVSRIIGGNRSNDHEEVIKSDENGNEDELWSDDEYESEGMEDYDDVLGVSYADIQAGDDNALAGASKDGNTTPQLSSYCCRDDSSSHSDEYYQCRPKRTSVIVDLTSDGNESDGTKQPLNHYKPQNIVQSTKYPTNVIGPSQTESIGDFSEDDKDLKPVSDEIGFKGRYGTYPNFQTVRQLCNCGSSNIDFNLMLKYQNGKARTDSYEVRQRKRMAKKQQKKGKKLSRKSKTKVEKSGKRDTSALPSRGLHNEGWVAVRRAHQWAPPDI